MPESLLNGEQKDVNGDNNEQHASDEENNEVEVHYEPLLPLIEVSNNEEEEVEMIKLRAKLYRYDSTSEPAEWKERGTGDVKLLRHKTKNTVRVVMRRDKTLKICANHFVTPWMELKPNCGSDRAWVWSVLADFADEQLKPELLAIRFANADTAQAWKDAFEKAKHIVGTECEIYAGKSNPDEKEADSHSDSSSYISFGDSDTDKEETKLSKQTGDAALQKDKNVLTSKEDEIAKNTNELSKELEKLKVEKRDEKE
ncbi:ran-specific GTPase-activating protein-like [Prorops nasuta]|uniref:ran-specific GTPase-activating protein-like n=1 Tax=Prorops nasuta TaxID=863751 RepID=UPI0034CFA7AC